ncbi:MAG: hypothetical protein JSS10_01010 [Verrucomicrobia bacterium]|nr:hypothetical protein [Verrucomicrobiota bacterium]
MNLEGAPMIIGTVCARAAVAAYYKIPLSHALVYNCVDMVVVAVVHTTLARYFESQIQGNKHTPGWLSRQIVGGIAAMVIAKITGALMGVGTSRALNCPVRPFHAAVITGASLMAFLGAGALGWNIKHYRLV